MDLQYTMDKRSSNTSCMQVHDIEDLAAAGTTNHACPYFAARSMAGTLASAPAKLAEYIMLLHCCQTRTPHRAGALAVAQKVCMLLHRHNSFRCPWSRR